MIQKPSLVKILTIDFAALLGVIIPPIFWAFFLPLFAGNQIPDARAWLVVLGGLTLICLIVVIWRWYRPKMRFTPSRAVSSRPNLTGAWP